MQYITGGIFYSNKRGFTRCVYALLNSYLHVYLLYLFYAFLDVNVTENNISYPV